MPFRQAKILSDAQIKGILHYLETTRYPKRNKVIFLLNVKAGLRVSEIADLKWDMVLDEEGNIGNEIAFKDPSGKCSRNIPLNKKLKESLEELKTLMSEKTFSGNPLPKQNDYIINSEREVKMVPHSLVLWFSKLYRKLGFDGFSSHSGRRTFITNCARNILMVGGSLKDVQELAGHQSLQMTQSYLEEEIGAKKRVIEMISLMSICYVGIKNKMIINLDLFLEII